jgi:CheY-like chemotaxis protein
MQLQGIERTIQRGGTVSPGITAKARRQVARLGRLIDDLLDFSRIQEGRLELDREDFTLNELAQHVTDDFRETTTAHRLSVVDETPAVMVRADRARLEQVLVNLLQNAIKYSPNGGDIALRVGVDGEEARVTVTDQGIGIPEEDQERLFQRFFRARNATSRNFGGLGLGLYLSQVLVQRHGGRFAVESSPGKGSSFSFFLPRVTATAQVNQGTSRILVVDDDPDILEGMEEFLTAAGYSVETAHDGAEALQRARQTRPDVLIVDLMMPIMDGAALIEKLREDAKTSHVPVIVFSADRQVYAKATSLQANGAMRKPIDFEELQETLRRILEQTTHAQRTVQ